MKKKSLVLLVVVFLLVLIGGGYFVASRQSEQQPLQTEEKQSGTNITIQTSTGESAVHFVTNSHIGIMTSEAIKLYTKTGKEQLVQEIAFNEPRAQTRENNLVIYDFGGKSGVVIENGRVLYQIKVEESIVFAKVNKNGYALLVTQGTLHKNAVRVYNKKGEEVFKWNSGGLYVINGDLSDDNQNFAVSTVDANVAPIGCAVYMFHTGKDTSTANAKFDNTIVSNVVCSNGNYYGITDNNLYILAANGTLLGNVDYSDRQLEDFVIDGSNAVLAFAASQYGINSHGSVIENYNVRGELIGQAQLDVDLKFLDCRGGTICAGDGETIGLYNTKCVLRTNVDIQSNLNDFRLLGGSHYGAAFTSTSIEIIQLN